MDLPVSRILERMKEKGLDQKTLAQNVGIRQQAVTEWKKGISSSYTKCLPQIAAVLDTSVEWIMTGTEVKKEPDTICDDVRQAEKLAAVLKSVGIDAERLTEADMLKVAKVIAAILQD